VAVIGDPETGKTSLISTAANDTFDARPPPVLPAVRLPPEFTPDHVPMLVTDTSSKPEDGTVLDFVVQQADAVVVCFDARRTETLESIRTEWYHRVQRLKPDVPVILACCKADQLTEEREIQAIRQAVERAVQDLPHVEVCLNCSSRTLRMVADVFYYALKAVLYPLQPLYDRIEKRLKPLCVRALKRAFVMCDADGDSALSDSELNRFQQVCFGMELTPDELQNVKQVVMSKLPTGVTERGLTLEGFLFLHVLFIERGRLESTWAVLRKFGYNDSLHLGDEVLDRLPWALPPDQVYELSEVAVGFVSRLFQQHDDDGDGLLTWAQQEALFQTVPPPVWQGESWNRVLVAGTHGAALRLEAFLLKWRYSCMMDPRTALSHLLYLGFGSPWGTEAPQLLTRCVRRRPDKKNEMTARSTVHCLVFGPRGSGKSSLLKALAGRPEQQVAGSSPLVSVGVVQGEEGRERSLVMTEVPDDVVTEFMTSLELSRAAPAGSSTEAHTSAMPNLARCDVAAFVFDASSSESFRAARVMMLAVSTAAGDTLPCVMVAAKDDLCMAHSLQYEVQTTAASLELPLPVPVSVETGELSGVFRRLVSAAVRPDGHIPNTPARKAHKLFIRRLYLGGGTALCTAVALYGMYRLYKWASGPAAPPTPPPQPSSSSSSVVSSVVNTLNSPSGSNARWFSSAWEPRATGRVTRSVAESVSKSVGSNSSSCTGSTGSTSGAGALSTLTQAVTEGAVAVAAVPLALLLWAADMVAGPRSLLAAAAGQH